MTKSFFDFVKAGGGRIEFVFHVGGMPYGVSTHEDVDTALDANLTHKRTIFGSAQNSNDSSYFADSVPIFANLDPDSIRESSIRMDESRGVLRGGNWEVNIFDKDLGYDWPYRNQDEYWGLDGIHTTVNPLIDRYIYWGYLQSNFKTGSTSIKVTEEVGGDLRDKIDALTGNDAAFLWVDHECIAVDDYTAPPALEYTQYTVNARGLFRSRKAEHFLDPDNISRKMVCDAPLGGITGRAAYVWAIVLDPNDNTSLLCDPALILKGRVRPGVSTSEGRTRIRCSDVLSWLDSKVESPEIPNIPGGRRYLDKYVLYRGPNNGTTNRGIYLYHQAPHLFIKEFEYDKEKQRYVTSLTPVWLCAQNSSVTFDTLDDLYLALNDELEKIGSEWGSALNDSQLTGDNSAQNGRVKTKLKYRISGDGVFIQDTLSLIRQEPVLTLVDVDVQDGNTFEQTGWKEVTRDFGVAHITGPLAWLLQLGPVAHYRIAFRGTGPYVALEDASIQGYTKNDIIRRLKGGDHWFNYAAECNRHYDPWLSAVPPDGNVEYEHQGGLFDEAVQQTLQSKGPEVSEEGYGRDFAAKYIYQTDDWTTATNTWPTHVGDLNSDFVNPPKNKTESSFSVPNNYLWLSKDTDISIDEVEADVSYSLGYKVDHILGGSSSGPDASAGTAANPRPRYAEIDVTAITTTGLYPRITISSDDIQSDVNSESPFRTGMALFFLPFLEKDNRDPWSFKSKFNFSTNNLGNAFRTLLGEELSSPKIGKRFTLSHVPDFIDDSSGDFEQSIDWVNLNRYTFPFTGGHYFTLVVDQDINFLKLMAEELKLFGIHMTREWDGTANTFVYRFHRIGVMNGSLAYTENRYLNDTNLERSAVREDHNDTWLFNQANVKLNWNGEKFDSPELIVKDISGFGSIGTVDRTFKVESKLTHLKNMKLINKSQWSELKKHIANNILVNMLRPMPTYSFEAGLNAALMLSVGKEVLVTDSSAAQPYTHEPGLTDNTCLITELSINWGRGKVRGKYRVGDKLEYGIAPAMLVQAGNSSIGTDEVQIIPDEHAYTDSDDRKDLSFFDCIGWNKSTRSYANLDCSCSDYRVLCIERDSNDPDVILATISDVDMTSGTATLTNDNDTIDSLWNVLKSYIIIYAPSDDANTQDCQLRWTYQADPRDGLIDTATSTLRARRWK